MEWDSWEFLSFLLSHALADILIHGHVLRGSYKKYIDAIKWANEFHDEQKANEWTWREVEPNLMECRPIKIHRMNGVDCLSQDIFIAIFTINNMKDAFTLEEKDNQIIEPVLKHLYKLVPWFKYQN